VDLACVAQTLKHLFSQHLTRPVCPGVP